MIPTVISSYVFKPSGEAVRGLELVIITVVLQQLSGIESVTDWQSWIRGVVIAVVLAAVAYAKGLLPSPTTPTGATPPQKVGN